MADAIRPGRAVITAAALAASCALGPRVRRADKTAPPEHIHFQVRYGDTPGIVTEVVFADDPNVTGGEPDAEVITLRSESGPDGKLLRGQFDIVLSAELD